MDPGERTTSTTRVSFARTRVRRPGSLVLRVLDGASSGVHEVPRRTLKVGRSALADLRLQHDSISKLHFELELAETGARLRDLGSTNGTWFGERRVEAISLEAGDGFRAGECRLRLEAIGEVEVEALETERLGLLVGKSLAMRELFAQLEALAPTPLDLLIGGETGTGKELAARTIHELSGRAGPFVVLDCAALSSSLADGTLFGFRRGAFTGADRDQPGVFEAAAAGTLFLDEIGELPAELQRKLLGVLERRTVSRLGEPARERRLDVRVLAATHRDLRERVAQGQFREDLYYRLARASVELLPLRARPEDLRLLAERFVARCCADYELELRLGDEAVKQLELHRWPGNVRELRNAIERACHLRRAGTITAEDLSLGDAPIGRGSGPIDRAIASSASYAEVHDAVDRVLLPAALDRHGHKLAPLARQLGISRDRLRKRLKELGLYAAS